MTSVPEITRLRARIAEWQDGHGKPGGRAEAARRLEEARKLLDEVANVLGRKAEPTEGVTVSDEPVTGILVAIERLRIDVLARLDRLEAGSTSDPDLVRAEITAHVQGVGDIEGNLGDWIGERRSGRWIEGFRIWAQSIKPEELLYRVVLDRDQVSPWVPAGKFCGSMGLAQPLRGLCLTLRGAAAAQYDCVYAATFIDGSVAGSVSGGQICAAATFAPLEAFQITLRNLRTTP